MYPEKYKDLVNDEPEELCPGGSIIVSPQGKVIAGPLFGKAGILNAEIELNDIINSKLDFDVNGHYSRRDLFDFKVNKQPEIKSEKDIH